MNFKYEEIPQITRVLFLPPCLIENSIHCSSSKFLSPTIRPLSLRLGKGLWHKQRQGKCFNSSVNTATEVYCYQADTWCKAAAASPGHLLCVEDLPADRPSPSKAESQLRGRSRAAKRRWLEFGAWRQWELGLSEDSLTESATFTNFKASCTWYFIWPIVSIQ